MARYFVEEATAKGEAGEGRAAFDGLAVAKASARKRARQSTGAVVVRHGETGEIMARYEPPTDKAPSEKGTPALANSVRRMRAANDRLKEALVPGSAGARKKRAQ
jgi:hypothetical protein